MVEGEISFGRFRLDRIELTWHERVELVRVAALESSRRLSGRSAAQSSGTNEYAEATLIRQTGSITNDPRRGQ
jgi:hypothetical protein